MSNEIQYCSPDDTLDAAARLMWDNDCGCVPVCTSDGSPRIVGMITDRDICMSALFNGRALSAIRVSEAMSREVHACRPADSPVAVERLMRERQIRRVPVADEAGALLGLVSLADLARCVARQTLSSADISGAELTTTLAAIVEQPPRAARATREQRGKGQGQQQVAQAKQKA
jgi:CBS domain-containing protein